jgi:protein-S-isoprenylcysteine O-methyltransferase Ste14
VCGYQNRISATGSPSMGPAVSVTRGRALPGKEEAKAMEVIDIIIGVGWIVFWAYWLVMAVTAKAEKSRWTQFAGVRVGIILVILILIRLRVFKGHAVATGNPWLLGIGLAFFVLGLALAVWARVYLGRNWGMPMSQRADPELVTTGPYRRIRHPIYSGIILAMAGTAIAVSPYWLAAVAIVGAYFLFSAVIEERNMAKLFPAAYPPYKRGTKMLIPYVL